MIKLWQFGNHISVRFRGSSLQTDGLRIAVFLFLFVHSIYSLSFFYWVDLSHYASNAAFEYAPTGLFKWQPLRNLGQDPNGLRVVQSLFTTGCLITTLGFALKIIQPLTVALGFLYFGVLNSYIHEANTEYMSLLALAAFTLPSRGCVLGIDAWLSSRDRSHQSTFSPTFFLCMILLALSYFNSSTSHIFFYQGWVLGGEPLKNCFLFKLNNDLNYSPVAIPGFSGLVEQVPAQVYHAGALASILFEGTFWTCLWWPGLRKFYLPVGFLFHLSIVFFMNIFFAPTLAIYVGLLWWEFGGKTGDDIQGQRVTEPEPLRRAA